MAERNAAVPADQRIDFRVDINLADIIHGGDIFGDGVRSCVLTRRAPKLLLVCAASACPVTPACPWPRGALADKARSAEERVPDHQLEHRALCSPPCQASVSARSSSPAIEATAP